MTIDGTLYTVSGTETHDGVEITVDDYFYADALAERGATLIMGKQSSETYSSGDHTRKTIQFVTMTQKILIVGNG
jgi:hypothetical protein